MGVPQRRERVFFIALRKDLSPKFMEYVDMFTELPKLELDFNEKKILFEEIYEPNGKGEQSVPPSYGNMWEKRIISEYSMCETTMRTENVVKFFSVKYLHKHKVLNTILGGEKNILYDEKRTLSKKELCKGGSYPLDYNFLDVKTGYLIGMSVPPLMTGKIAEQIYKQWLSKLRQ
jgi:DNA (cytosine-5)-methyltransferase 1